MKYITVLLDGAGDNLNEKTPLEVAKCENIKKIEPFSEMGLVFTIPENMEPGSDIGNLSTLGYDPKVYHKGRSPLEALSAGVSLNGDDVTFRMNLVTLSDDDVFEQKKMIDYGAGEITTEESEVLVKELHILMLSMLEEYEINEEISIHKGISYRHILKWVKGSLNVSFTPPHNISGKVIGEYLPKGDLNHFLINFMKRSYDLLSQHEINIKRRGRNLHEANCPWFWGEGVKPLLPSFQSQYGLKGSVISAVDLIKGLGIAASMDVIEIENATGNIHTNFTGKKDGALKAILTDNKDFVYIHLEAPDECGHQKNRQCKVESLEIIDREVIGPIIDKLNSEKIDFKILITSDHRTPLNLGYHTMDPVPYLIYNSSNKEKISNLHFNEVDCEKGQIMENGPSLIERFFENE